IYVFADEAKVGAAGAVAKVAKWLDEDPHSPVVRTPGNLDSSAWFDIKVIYQRPYDEFEMTDVPAAFKPVVGPYKLDNYENVFTAGPNPEGKGGDIFEARGISRKGAIVVVRPDQYVANIVP